MVSIETKKYLTKNRTVSAKKRHITLSVRPYKSMIKVSSLSIYHSSEHLLIMMDSKSGRHCWRKLSLGLAKCRRGDPGGLDSHQRLGVGARSFWKKMKMIFFDLFSPCFFLLFIFSLWCDCYDFPQLSKKICIPLDVNLSNMAYGILFIGELSIYLTDLTTSPTKLTL